MQNATGYGLRGVRVALYDGETEIAAKTTSSSGYATFGRSDIIELGEYTVRLSELPRGYVLSEPDVTYQTLPIIGFEAFVQLDPIGVIKETAPIGTGYSVGEVMYDFTVTTSDGEEFTLSEVLKEKEMVLINFWATWCNPCIAEFPAMNNAYIAYQDKVEVLAVSTSDSMRAVAEFKSNNGLQFKMTSNSESGANLYGMFPTTGIPLSIMVDRYGVITYYHAGNMTAAIDFTSRFDLFLGENYEPTIIIGSGDISGGGSSDEENNLIKPTVKAPALSDIQSVFAQGSDDFTFSWDESEEYAWPWLIVDSNDYIYSPIAEQSVHGNFSTLKATFNAGPGDAVFFDYMVHSEDTDVLYVLVDGVIVQQISGANNTYQWETDFGGYVFREYEEEGEHEIIFIYQKDSDESLDKESIYLKNLRLVKDADLSTVNSNVFRHAANILNEDEDAKTLYKHYASVVLNETDGYYHVCTLDHDHGDKTNCNKNGPLLFANLILSSRWSDTSVWLLAYNNYIVVDGYNFNGDIEEYAWGANQPIPGKQLLYGYMPVTEDLKELLIYATKSESVGENGYKLWTGEWHENEWLETCVYFDNYGNAAPIEDPMKTITFHAAEKVEIGTEGAPVKNTANVLFSMTPRGFKYKIVHEVSGIYNIYSDVDSDSQLDPVCFFFGESTTEFEYYDYMLRSDDAYNFNFHVYLEAGKTYYIALTTFLDRPGEYDFYVTRLNANSHKYMVPCATGYSFNEISGELFVLDGINYQYSDPQKGGDGYYHVLNADGTLGSIIYVDMMYPTILFPEDSLRDIANAALQYEVERRAFYIRNAEDSEGVDYTNQIAYYARESLFSDPEGFVPLNQELFDILRAITMSDKYEGIDESWQMLCYYEVELGQK